MFSRERTNYPLALQVDDDGDGLSTAVDAASPIDPRAVSALIRTAAENLVTALEDAIDGGPELPLSAVQVLDESACRKLLAEWNGTPAEAPRTTAPELFEAQVARTPEAVAVVADGVEMSYGELEARANRLARLLAGRGVGPESVVGVCLERGVELMVALLGVWKAGGAYLPLDPGHPAERTAFALGDAGAVCV